MAKIIRALCDYHLDEYSEQLLIDAEDSDSEEKISIGGETYTVDLCPLCKKEWLEPFRDKLQRIGVQLGRSARGKARDEATSGNRKTCELCGADFKHTKTLNDHLEADHYEWTLKNKPQLISKPCKDQTLGTFKGCDLPVRGRRGMLHHVRQGHAESFDAWHAAEFKGDDDTNSQTQLAVNT